jgi:hypothetical protein
VLKGGRLGLIEGKRIKNIPIRPKKNFFYLQKKIVRLVCPQDETDGHIGPMSPSGVKESVRGAAV